jgi:hypothetical protein
MEHNLTRDEQGIEMSTRHMTNLGERYRTASDKKKEG